jgi:hypothetical protein
LRAVASNLSQLSILTIARRLFSSLAGNHYGAHEMTIIARTLFTLLDQSRPVPWFAEESRLLWSAVSASDWPHRQPRTPASRTHPATEAFSDLQAYQASHQGLVERHVYDLAAVTAALAEYAAAPATRNLVANEVKDIEVAVRRLGFVLQLLAEETQP